MPPVLDSSPVTAPAVSAFLNAKAGEQSSLRDAAALEQRGTSTIDDIKAQEDKKIAVVQQSVNEFVDSVKELYKRNGKPDNVAEEVVKDYQKAISTLLSKLDPSFDREAFAKLNTNAGMEAANAILIEKGYILSNVSLTGNATTHRDAVFNMNFQRIISHERVDAENLNTKGAGCIENPFTAPVRVFETRTMISPSNSSAAYDPVKVISLDKASGAHAIIIEHDTVHAYLPSSNPNQTESLDPRLKKLLVDTGIGNLAFSLSSENGTNTYPPADRVGEKDVSTKKLLALHYALHQQTLVGNEAASFLVCALGSSRKNSEDVLNSALSVSSRRDVSKTVPGFIDITTPIKVLTTFERNVGSGQSYVDGLRARVDSYLVDFSTRLREQREGEALKEPKLDR